MAKAVKPLFMRGDYETAVFRAFKEVEVRVRKKAALGNEMFGRNLMVQAFGETGALTDKVAQRANRTPCVNFSAGQSVRSRTPRATVRFSSKTHMKLWT
jgi:hypothetical protein